MRGSPRSSCTKSRRPCDCIKDQGITTIIVEQNAVRALKLADRAVILDTGVIVFDGTARRCWTTQVARTSTWRSDPGAPSRGFDSNAGILRPAIPAPFGFR